jgi:hypothetical protein
MKNYRGFYYTFSLQLSMWIVIIEKRLACYTEQECRDAIDYHMRRG